MAGLLKRKYAGNLLENGVGQYVNYCADGAAVTGVQPGGGGEVKGLQQGRREWRDMKCQERKVRGEKGKREARNGLTL
ncbi:hypothetical protein EYF80_032885 [Liparis tanakae]|uniref:Uncharacterized protein n=1 Tax=Liparis tanakae TaxID=230148 RepID=A0A4Z2GUW4_9TELE|nr:hypothetical protein EYF80_032885 [Liparis tanakae]